LILTELILDNTLGEFEPEEIVALLSAFVFEEKTDTEPQISPRLEEVSTLNRWTNVQGKELILRIAHRVNEIQERHQVLISGEGNDFEARPRFGLMEVVYEWARGMSFNRITDLTDVLEGTIVRVITRIDETCREVSIALQH
jgi:antiviral helicase SKI2